jgi:hypothetical protein
MAASLVPQGMPEFLMPPYRDLVLAFWPVAQTLAGSAKHRRRCWKQNKQARHMQAAVVKCVGGVLESTAAQYAEAAMAASGLTMRPARASGEAA